MRMEDMRRAVRINEEHNACEEAGRKALEHAIACGELLAEARQAVRDGNGSWMTWVKENFEGSKSTEENYRKLAHNKQYLTEPVSQRVANLSIREALALLAPERDDGESEKVATGQQSHRTSKSRSNSGNNRRKKELETGAQVYRDEDLPVEPGILAAHLAAGTPVALYSDLSRVSFGDNEEKLAGLLEFLEHMARASLEAQSEGYLRLLWTPVAEIRAVDEELLEEGSGDDEEEVPEAAIEKFWAQELRKAGATEQSLHQIIVEAGGIRPPKDKRLREEYQAIPSCYKRKDGISGDEMADYLATYHPEYQIYSERELIDYFARRRRESAA